MRVTNRMISSKALYNLNSNLSRLDKLNTQLSTGKRINRPSDDPVAVAKALRLRGDISQIEQNERNTKNALSWLNITESAITDIKDVIHNAKELAVRAASETNAPEDRKIVADEIEQLKKHLLQIGNTAYTGKYIFSGFQTDKKLFDDTIDDGTYNIDITNVQTIEYKIGTGETIDVGVFGTEIFGDDGANKSQLIADFDDLINDLKNDDTTGINDSLTDLDQHLNNTLAVMSEIGAKTNRLELTLSRLENDKLNFTELLSENEDVDLAETIMHFKMEESVYRASLSSGAQVIQPTLLDFIR